MRHALSAQMLEKCMPTMTLNQSRNMTIDLRLLLSFCGSNIAVFHQGGAHLYHETVNKSATSFYRLTPIGLRLSIA